MNKLAHRKLSLFLLVVLFLSDLALVQDGAAYLEVKDNSKNSSRIWMGSLNPPAYHGVDLQPSNSQLITSLKPKMAPVRHGVDNLSPNDLAMPRIDLSHLTGQNNLSLFNTQALPTSFDWRDHNGVTPVKDQGDFNASYAFASLGNFESQLLIDSDGEFDFSENNAKECNWSALNNPGATPDISAASLMLASLFSQVGTVLEACDAYQASDGACKVSCPPQKTLLDWRIISGASVPAPEVLKNYIYTYGPVYTTMYVNQEFSSYDGTYTLDYVAPSGNPNHSVLIIGWSDNLPSTHGSSSPASGWIVKNSYGTDWGDDGYFYITYGAANIGMYSSFIADWQDYDPSGFLLYYDNNGLSSGWGFEELTSWGMAKYIPANDLTINRVEFWTTDITSDVDVYLYNNFDGTHLSGLLASKVNLSFSEAGYHSVLLDTPVPIDGGEDVFAAIRFTNANIPYPIAADITGPIETEKTYISPDFVNWDDLGRAETPADVAIRLRTTSSSGQPDIQVNPTAIEKTISPGGSHVSWVNINNSGTPSLQVNIAEAPEASWLVAAPNSLTLLPGATGQVRISLSAAGLGYGNYHTELVLSNNDPDENPVIIPVTMHVSQVMNTPPTFAGLPDRTVQEGSRKDDAIDLWLYAADSESQDSQLHFSITGITDSRFGVTIDSNRYIDINPPPGLSGQASVTVRVTDPGGLHSEDTFVVNITPIQGNVTLFLPVTLK